VPGTPLLTDPADRGPLVLAGRRWHREVLLLAFEGIGSREEAEELRGTELVVPVTELPALEDPEEFYDHQLVGLAARLPDGTPLGEVTAVRHEGNSLLVVQRPDAGRPELLVPFVSAIVPTVDVAGGVVVVDPPEGLLEL
jgi:16S rRNA processing protein RimM